MQSLCVLGQVQRLLPSPGHPRFALPAGQDPDLGCCEPAQQSPGVRAAGERAGLFFSDFPRSQQGFCGCSAHSPE